MSFAPGRKSTEYAKALRAEAVGLLVLGLGVALAMMSHETERACVGVALAAVGAFILARANDAYALARGGVKAAAVRRPADIAPRAL